jgi:ribosome-associated heat shock protein Hsp15
MANPNDSGADERHRIDVWLKHVCLFKHRGDATEACKGGHVKINGLRVKPAAKVSIGDTVEFLLGTAFRKVIVQELPATQASKETARTMYIDETPKPEKLELAAGIFRERGSGRPTKKERREIERIKR